MRIRTDDEVYRVDAVWLGPPRATMPWRARYVAWGVGVFVFLIVLTVERRIGISLFWSIAWGIVATIVLTRFICSRISHERPLSAVAALWLRELTAPREATAGQGGAVTATRVRVNATRPRRRPKGQRQPKSKRQQPGKQRQPRRQTKRGRGGGVRTPTKARA